MARKKIREHDGKRLLKAQLAKLAGLDIPLRSVLVTRDTDWNRLLQENPWLVQTRLVVKPDMLFGKRGKSGLVKLNLSLEEAREFLAQNMDKEIEFQGKRGALTHWLVEPYVEHTNEFYVAIASAGAADEIYFSPAGGMEVEEQWGQVRSARVPVEAGVQLPEDLDAQLGLDRVPAGPLREGVARFLRGLYSVFVAQDFVSLEINPFTVDVEGRVLPLDLVAELDECAAYRHPADWERVEFPAPFGRRTVAEEERVAELDAKTGASLKLTVLNPHARLWLMVAGGGASVIFADTVADLGYGADLGNYGEYSGNPNEEETAAYARCVLALATRPHPDAPPNERRALLIGGGIANFTDVAKTFKGIVRAIEEYQDAIRRCRMKIFVRRAGPNYQTGLRMMRDLGRRLGLDIEVYGPEHVMTSIIPRAIEYIQQP